MSSAPLSNLHRDWIRYLYKPCDESQMNWDLHKQRGKKGNVSRQKINGIFGLVLYLAVIWTSLSKIHLFLHSTVGAVTRRCPGRDEVMVTLLHSGINTPLNCTKGSSFAQSVDMVFLSSLMWEFCIWRQKETVFIKHYLLMPPDGQETKFYCL